MYQIIKKDTDDNGKDMYSVIRQFDTEKEAQRAIKNYIGLKVEIIKNI